MKLKQFHECISGIPKRKKVSILLIKIIFKSYCMTFLSFKIWEFYYNLKIYEHDTEIYSGSGMAFPGIRSTGTLAGTDYIYENLAHNFFAEVPNFFLKKLSSLTSKPEEEWVFKGPLSSSAGVRKFAMNIIVEKSKDFTMHDGAAYFGHAPYHHHLPSWYPLRDRVKGINGHYFRAACSGSDRMCYNPDPDAGLIPPKAGWSQNQGVAEILFDPKLIHDKAPERFFICCFAESLVLADISRPIDSA